MGFFEKHDEIIFDVKFISSFVSKNLILWNVMKFFSNLGQEKKHFNALTLIKCNMTMLLAGRKRRF